jgi:flagellar hook assembly protein FlgD
MTIRYSLPVASMLDLEVHDASGACVRRLQRGAQSAGDHQVSWNGRDEAGRRLPAGLYLVRIAAGGAARGGKVILCR